jgi:hypothetical protein
LPPGSSGALLASRDRTGATGRRDYAILVLLARLGLRAAEVARADGEVTCNAGNWQWVAGTGNNPRPGRVLNPLRQAARFDHDGNYVRRYIPVKSVLG